MDSFTLAVNFWLGAFVALILVRERLRATLARRAVRAPA